VLVKRKYIFMTKDDYKKYLPLTDPLWGEQALGTGFQGFQNLMRNRIRDILLVSSLYDLYILEEDGRLYELIRDKYQGLGLSHTPELTRVSSGSEAIALAKEERRFDLIITTFHIEDMNVVTLAKKLRKEKIDIPIVLLAFDNRELSQILKHNHSKVFDQLFIWQGDFRLMIAIIKLLEDRMNVEHDSRSVGVQSIIVIEDSIRYYSSLLPMIYFEVMKQSRRLVSESLSVSHMQLRRRARPKILLCKNYDEAWNYFTRYQDTVLGIISDIDFPRNGKEDPLAGLEFAREVKKLQPDIPVLLHSALSENEEKAKSVEASFLLKNSPTLLEDIREYMETHLSFGDFVFRTPDGREVGRAHDLSSFEKQIKVVPGESLLYHGARNHFSNWLKARTEFWLAYKLRPRKVTEFSTVETMRQDLISSLREYRKVRQRGTITDFNKESFDPNSSISRIGGGALGGKARGLAFVNILINNYKIRSQFKDVQVYIPPAIILGTDIFDQFLEENDLRHFALYATNDKDIEKRFLKAKKFPKDILRNLSDFLELVQEPLAVRSSSLLEDSHNQPFAGVYKTYMLPNSQPDLKMRLKELLKAIKRVYASTFLNAAREYIKSTAFRLEEEKMAVIVQKMIGTTHHDRFYPDFSGVARSHNFYPIAPQKAADGIVSVALGLGKMVVEGGTCMRFSPKYPTHNIQFSTPKLSLQNSQQYFYAVALNGSNEGERDAEDYFVRKYPLKTAEEDGVLYRMGSTYSAENDHVYDGISRKGIRLVTFAPILKNKLFPLADILNSLLKIGSKGMGTPVEIEFAVNCTVPKGETKEFGVLQVRPMVLNQEMEYVNLSKVPAEKLICSSKQVMGNGIIKDVFDIVLVDWNHFDRSQSRKVAAEVGAFNSMLASQNRNYLLVGVGRWGTLDPWLGIPVTWDQIAGARVIIETGFKDFDVMPSQGSHFFQNLNSFNIGYFTISTGSDDGFVDWDWLLSQPAEEAKEFTRLLHFENPVVIKMNGQKSKGIILKPGNNH